MEPINPAHVVMKIDGTALSPVDRDRAVKAFWADLRQLNLANSDQITPLRNSDQGNTLCGLTIRLSQPEYMAVCIQAISDRLEKTSKHITVCLTTIVDRLRVQLETESAEELLSLVPVVNMTLPARQIFQARAATYASREGEFSPVEEENLNLLCYQLNLDPDVADEVKELALGPYQTRQEKLKKYRQVLIAELDRQPLPLLSDTTQAELQRLRQSLGLSPEDVKFITQEEIAERQPPPVVEDPRDEAEEAAKRQAALRQKQIEQYRQLFASVITRRLEPTEFDQGRLDQARRAWELDKDLVQQIEREVTDERYGPTDSAILGQDYTRLRRLLWRQQWEDADRETERLLLSALSSDMRPLSETAILSLNQYCTDVRTIDRLWSRHSQGRFGFAAQYQVYAQQERQPSDFLAMVEWTESIGVGGVALLPRRKAYRELQFDLQAPIGHLPTWRWAAESLEGDYVVGEDVVQNMFHEVLEKCLPRLKALSSSLLPEAGADKP
ncbi:MAG: GUN4 domain-containing protein [Cyanobacteria bacterium P01_H01_bin.153]